MKIVRTGRYARDLKRLKSSASDIDEMEREIAARPEAGVLIPGLRGLRKIRFRIGNRGKSGGGRAVYYMLVSEDAAIMLAAYAKAEKADLSPDDRKAILRVLEEFER